MRTVSVKLPDDHADALEQVGTAEVLRALVAGWVEARRRAATDAAIVEGYRRRPQTEEEVADGLANLERTIREEPW